MTDDLDEDMSIGDPIVREAHKLFRKCERWEATARQRFMDDIRFDAADDINNYMWPGDVLQDRGERPSLTINRTHAINNHIVNDALQKKSGVKYRPVGDGATKNAADVFTGISRHIYDISHAQDKHGVAIGFQVRGGIGYTTVYTDYVSDSTFDQEIYIGVVPDPMSAYLDPDHVEKDGSDSRYGFIFVDRPRDEAEEKYPWLKEFGAPPRNEVDSEMASWLRADHVREAKYFKVEEVQDELIGDEEGNTILKSDTPKDLIAKWEEEAEKRQETLKRRDVVTKKVWIYVIVGDRVVSKDRWAGTTVPIIPWLGEETIIDQQLDRKGHTRCMRDANRMLNYNRSASIEFGALQVRTPWITTMEGIQEFETYWSTANVVNHAYLPYNAWDENGREIAPPQRIEPPQSSPVFAEGAHDAEQDLQTVSGIYEASEGAPSNEKSGRAITERQRMGDRATYHFIDNQATAIRREGAILLELIPKIYDTKRVIRLLGEDGSDTHAQVDPDAEQAHAVEGATIIFNPNVGRYSVVSDVGPDYATQRQEAFDAITQVMTADPALMARAGDLLFKAADFPLSDELAERLKPPAMDPAVQAQIAEMQKQQAKTAQQLADTLELLGQERSRNKNKDSDDVVKAYDADTKRLGVIKDMLPLDPSDMQKLIHETVRQALQDNLGPAVMASVSALQSGSNTMQGSDPSQSAPAPQANPYTGQPQLPQLGQQ